MEQDRHDPEKVDDHGSEIILYRRRWVVLAVFSLISMANEMIWISLSSITSIVRKYYRVSSLAVNWLSMIYLIFLLFVTLCSYFLNKYGLKLTIIVGAVLNGVGSCLRVIGSHRDGFPLVFAGSTLAAVAASFLFFIPPRLAAVWFGEHERTTASSMGMVLTFAGVAIGFLSAVLFVPSSEDMDNKVRAGMQNLLIFQAALCCFLAVISFVCIQDAPPTPPSRSQQLLELSHFRTEKDEKEVPGISHHQLNQESSDLLPLLSSNHEDNSTDIQCASSRKIPSFKESIILLAWDKEFHFIWQAYGLYFGVMNTFSTVLNQITISRYPGREKEIGYMGFASVVFGMISMSLSGIILDKTKRYKTLSVVCFASCTMLTILFSINLKYVSIFELLFVNVCLIGFFSFTYVSSGLEYAAEISYPIPEGTTSGVLILLGSIYSIVFTYSVGALLESGHYDLCGYIFAGLYFIGLLLILKGNPTLKRSRADGTL